MCNWIFWCCSCHETKAKKKEKWKKRQKQGTKRKQKERQEGRKKEKKKRERQRKRNRKWGRPKKAKGERKRNTENKQKMPFSKGKTRFFVLKAKKGKETKKQNKKQKTTKRKTNKKKENKKTRKKEETKSKNTKRIAFQLSVKLFLFLAGFSTFPFLTPWPKKRAPKKHDKNRGFRHFFLKSRCASRKGHFWDQKTKIDKFQLSFFCLFSSLSTTKIQKNAETPIFIVF